MNRRQGFTLIELLIVVTIIAILAGAAVPYVQDYVDQARSSRAKADLDEIKRAIMLYEVQYGTYTGSDIASLVGPFLTRNLPDPWGNAYKVSNDKSIVYTMGPDGDEGTSGDNISVEFRPRMAVTRVNFVDVDGDGVPSNNDLLSLKVCRPVTTANSVDGLDLVDNDGTSLGTSFSTISVINDTLIHLTLSGVSTPIVLSKTKLSIASNNAIQDGNAGKVRVDAIKVLYE